MSHVAVMAAFGASLALAGTAGCGSDVLVYPPEHTGGTGGNHTTTTTTTTTGPGGIGGGGIGGTGGTGGSDSCSPWDDEQGSYEVTVRFRNDAGLPIYLPASCGVVLYDLQSDVGSDITYAFDPFCLQTCEDLQTQGIIDCAACPPSSVLLLPGAVLDLKWDGTGLHPAQMPLDCWADPYGQTSCPQILAAEPGTYRIASTGYSSCGNGSCGCDAGGVCDGDAMGTEAMADPVQLTFPGTALVEVVFGVCAFPCPE